MRTGSDQGMCFLPSNKCKFPYKFRKKKTSRGYAQSYKNNPDIFNSADNEKQI